ncbi:MAG: hypothetical protein IPK04_03135 [Bdellovibrionales bacterium]|nr:hypothetical protein [Bdellovibrionales bacterium]
MKQFPWRVFFQFVIYQVVFFGFAFLVIIVNLGFFSEASVKEVPALLWAKSFFYFLVLALIGASLNAYKFSRPIQRTLYMARRLANKNKSRVILNRQRTYMRKRSANILSLSKL